MKITAPSAFVISTYLQARYKIAWELAIAFNAIMKACNKYKPTPDQVHTFIDTLLGNHGVESFRVKVRGKVRTVYYSNTGDTYMETILRWEWTDGLQKHVSWFVGSWGDIAERYPEVRE